MEAEDLRKSILQLAIQEKLVKQNSDDEPASALIDKIREEKETARKRKQNQERQNRILYLQRRR
jgi:type I restriction enzyme S subunit